MDSAARAEDSSSPSANRRIVSAKRDGALGCLAIGCQDGSSFFVREGLFSDILLPFLVQVSGLTDADLKENPQEIPPELLEALLLADLASRAYYKALDLLARAEQCRSMLEAKLAVRKYPREAVKRALDLLVAEGSLDDERYARAWLRSRRRRKAEGKSKLVAALRAKGIRSEQVSRALAATAEESSPALERLIEALKRNQGEEKEAIIRDLRKAGYSSGEIRALERDPEE